MKPYRVYLALLVIQLFCLSLFTATPAYADRNPGNSFASKNYAVYLYNAEEGSTTISFEENLSLVINAYDGFGLYIPIGNLFFALYWAPKYHEEDDLLLIFNGVLVSDFIEGWGVVLPNYKFTGIFLFFGYEE